MAPQGQPKDGKPSGGKSMSPNNIFKWYLLPNLFAGHGNCTGLFVWDRSWNITSGRSTSTAAHRQQLVSLLCLHKTQKAYISFDRDFVWCWALKTTALKTYPGQSKEASTGEALLIAIRFNFISRYKNQTVSY